jgi:hypothetical protein
LGVTGSETIGFKSATVSSLLNCGWDHNCPGKSHDFKSYIINKCLIGVVTAYATYELGAAVWKAGENMTADDEVGFI